MPELPEVQTVVNSLQSSLTGSTIRKLKVHWPRSLEKVTPKWLSPRIANQKIQVVERRAKWILLVLENGSAIGFHLRMTGKLYPCTQSELDDVNLFHVSAIFHLDQDLFLVFEDQRRFGRIRYLPDPKSRELFSQALGPEPLGPDFSNDWFAKAVSNKRRQIKPLLLDQSFLAGLGNIYVDEALWLSAIHPQMMASQLTTSQLRLLRNSICKVLRKAIRSRGTSFMNFSYMGKKTGSYADQLLVFRRTGQPCLRCESIIERIKVAQRSTHLCPQCQKLAD